MPVSKKPRFTKDEQKKRGTWYNRIVEQNQFKRKLARGRWLHLYKFKG